MRPFLIVLSILLLSIAAGCDKESPCNNCIRLQYAQTHCADAWGYGTDGSDTQVQLAISDFFVSNGLQVYEVSIVDNGGGQACLACNCTTGKIIYVVTDASSRSSFELHGFY